MAQVYRQALLFLIVVFVLRYRALEWFSRAVEMDPVSFVRKHYENRAFRCLYKPSELVGKGTYGRVFKGTAPNGAVVALKEIIVDPEEGIPLSTLRELSVLRKIQSYNSSHLVQ